MKYHSPITRAVCAIIDRINPRNPPWVIVGGASLFLQGGTHIPDDIDIVSNRSGVLIFAQTFARELISPPRFSRSGTILSFFVSIKLRSTLMHVEIMGDPINRIGQHWKPNVLWRRSINFVSLAGRRIPVSSLGYELEINHLTGNAKRVKEIGMLLRGTPSPAKY